MDSTITTATDASNYQSTEVDFTANSSRSSSGFDKSNTTSSSVDTDSSTTGTYVSTWSAVRDVSDNSSSNDDSSTRIGTNVSSTASASSFIMTSPSTNTGENFLTNNSITVSTSPTNSPSVSTSISTSTNISTSLNTSTSVRNNFSTSTTVNTTTNVVTTYLDTDASISITANTSPSVGTDASLGISATVSTSPTNSTNVSTSPSTNISTSASISTSTNISTNIVTTYLDMDASISINANSSPSVGSDTSLISTSDSFSTSSPITNTKISTNFTANDSVGTEASSSPNSSTKVDINTSPSVSSDASLGISSSDSFSTSSPSTNTKVSTNFTADDSGGTKTSSSPNSSTKVDVNTSPSVSSDTSLGISSSGSFSTSSPSTNTKVSTNFTADDSVGTKTSSSPNSSVGTKTSSSPNSSTKVDVSTSTSFSRSVTSSQIRQGNATRWHSTTQTQGSISYTTSDVTSSNGTTHDDFSSVTKTASTGTTIISAAVSGGIPTTVSQTVSVASISEKQTGWIAAPVVLGALLLVAVIIIVILFKLRRKPKRKFHRCFGKHKDDSFSSPLTTWPTSEYARPVRVQDFVAHVANLHRDLDFGFATEFEMLIEQSPQFPKSAAELPENRSKNRYTNILPFDQDRVKLTPMDDDMTGASDYINASFLPGVSYRREYIATQGPLPGTFDDFWRMIWDYNVTTLVMVTDLVENGRVLTAQYWPNQKEPVHYGDIRVELTSEAVVGNYVLRIFSVSLDDKSRLVKQFHLTNWKDRSSFNNVEEFLAFQGDVRRSLINPPLLVHCSAGVGRTGTFIAVDHLLQKIELESIIGVFHLILEMRNHRMNMVQTLKQYCFVHDCISYAIEHGYHKGIPIPSGNSSRDLKEPQTAISCSFSASI